MRFDLEVARRFHPEAHDERLYRAGTALSRRLALDSVATLRTLARSRRGTRPDRARDAALVTRLAERARAVEAEVRAEMLEIATELARARRAWRATHLSRRSRGDAAATRGRHARCQP